MSAALTVAAQSLTRQPRARVTIDWADPYRDLSIVATPQAGQENRISWPAQIADTVLDVPYKYLHLDDTTPLSAGMHPAPSTQASAGIYQMGWWGADECDGSGDFAADQVIELTYTSRPVYGFKVSGDDAWGEYPVDFKVEAFDAYDIIRSTVNVTGNTDQDWEYSLTTPVQAITKLRLTVSKWSEPNRVLKIAEFFDAIIITYDGDDIMSIDILEESEVKKGSLPTGNISANECDLTLQNLEDTYFPDNSDSLIAPVVGVNRKISVEMGFVVADGSTEYEPMGTFWSGDWTTEELGTRAKTSARDRMELLRKSTYVPGEVFEDYTLYDLLVEVLEDAKTQQLDLTYTIDTELDGADFVVPYAVFERKSHFETIRRICQAGMAFAYASREDVITIVGPTAATAEMPVVYDPDGSLLNSSGTAPTLQSTDILGTAFLNPDGTYPMGCHAVYD